MKNLLIVESPTKARTIEKYLGADFEVLATVGHLRDLPKSKMGVDLKHDFEIDYQIDAEKKKVVSGLILAAAKATNIYLATDPDREGEAIAFHVDWILRNPPETKSKIKNSKVKRELVTSRVSFHEITKEAVQEALKHAKGIDMNLVDAQQGRRVLDRVVGYSLSPVLWKKVRRGLSAGRVQSVALRLIVEREKEVELFKREKYFKVYTDLGFRTDLFKVDDESAYISDKIKLFDGEYSYTKSIFDTRVEVDKFVAELSPEFVVSSLNERETTRHPLPPYTTSKLQQAGGRRFGWSGKQTMTLAQRLYEKGLITYHRTDSVNLSVKAIEEFRKYISSEYGEKYVAEKVRAFKNTSKNAQEAHEAIRPTSVSNKNPDGLDAKELKLYQIIWKRAVATQAASAKLKNTTAVFGNGRAQFKSIGVSMLFDGFLKIADEKFEEEVLPLMKEGEVIKSKKITIEENETNPPPRYSDASLVQSLEKQGIGRPSTYASIISTILARQYVERDEGKYHPTALGVAVIEFLVKNFLNIVSLPFTAEMEEELDQVAMGKVNWKKMMRKFWDKFEGEVKKVESTADRVKVAVEKTGEKCPDCKDGDLVIRLGRFGKFVSCDRFPDCKYTAQYKEAAGFMCPTCGKEGVVRKTKTGRKFFGCSDYPNCKWAGWKKPLEEKLKVKS
ncbi:MAG: type I DNA topoisomerase [Candidatus Levybacteria bacterium]|nr:type I DNA topoisomerase [Candidatus Levybacteria bacterium]